MPITGALAGMLPLRLGGDAATGWTAAQHARVCADLVALQRVQPLGTWTYTQTGSGISAATISSYVGRNGSGLAWAPSLEVQSLGVVQFFWPASKWPDPYSDAFLPVTMRAATASFHLASRYMTAQVASNGRLEVRARSDSGANALNSPVSVTVWGSVGTSATSAIGDYAGDPDKKDSETEGRFPYAEFLLADFQSQRGTAYTKEPNKLVDVENLALARFFTACGPRLAEKFRKNMQPATADERLPYFERLLAVPKKPGEPKWRTRQKLTATYRGSEGATDSSIRAALQKLLGDVFVDMSWSQGASLAVPPTQTFWPVINPGDPSLSLGGGAWSSERCHLVVTVQKPTGMTTGDFLTLLDVDMFQMLDQMLPGWATFSWSQQADNIGFFLDISNLDFTRLTDS